MIQYSWTIILMLVRNPDVKKLRQGWSVALILLPLNILSSATWEINELPDLRICPPVWRHTVAGVHGERKRTRVCAIWSVHPSQSSCPCQNNQRRVQRNAPVSQLHVKQYRVPLKTSDKKAHMIPELQSPIPSAKAASAFLSVWMLQQHGGKKIVDKAKTEEMWQSNGHFHGEGKTGAKGVILGLLWASKRWIKMVGYRGALHFCLFFLSLFDLLQIWAT